MVVLIIITNTNKSWRPGAKMPHLLPLLGMYFNISMYYYLQHFSRMLIGMRI